MTWLSSVGRAVVLLAILLPGCRRQPSTEELIEQLGSADQGERLEASFALAMRGDVVVPDLLDAMDDERPVVRVSASGRPPRRPSGRSARPSRRPWRASSGC